MAEVELRYSLFYETNPRIPAWQVAEALLSLEAISRRTPRVLEHLFEGLTIEQVTIYLEQLRAGSLYEDLVVKFIFGDQKSLDDSIKRARRTLGFDLAKDHKVVACVLLLLILGGGEYAVTRLLHNGDAKQAIQNNQTTVVVIGADAADVSPELFREALRAGVAAGGERDLANHSVKVLRPAKGHERGQLVINGDNDLRIGPDTLRSIPQTVFPDRPAQSQEDLDDVTIEIRATDLDSNKRGWGVRIEAVSQKRLPMEIAPEIEAHKLASGATLRGNVTVVYETEEGKRVPRRVFLRGLAEQSGDEKPKGPNRRR